MDRQAVRLAGRVRELKPSPTMAVDSRAKELARAGVDVINFGAGEPDFPTPEHVKEAGIAAIRGDRTRYTSVPGIPELRAAVCRKLAHDHGLSYAPDEVIVTSGGKQAIFNALMALCEPADEVLIPAPYWVSYPEQVRLCGGVPRFVETRPEHGFRLRADDVAAALTPRTRILVLNSPNNPTGAMIPPAELEGIARLAVAHDLWVISDEIYEKIVYGDVPHASIASLPGMRERTVLVNGLSKSAAMTGWRLGYAAAPREVVEAMAAVQGQVTSHAASIAQYAAVAALEGPEEPLRRMVEEYRWRRDYVLERLRAMPGITCVVPDGAFYAFPSVAGLVGRRLGDREIDGGDALALLLLEEAKVAVVPGSAFGAPLHVRLSFATSRAALQEGLNRMEALLRRVGA